MNRSRLGGVLLAIVFGGGSLVLVFRGMRAGATLYGTVAYALNSGCAPAFGEVAAPVEAAPVRVAGDVCAEASPAPADPGMVLLACAYEAGEGRGRVLLPRVTWETLRAPFDAGGEASP
jgi:hypothetical protein